MDMRLTEINSEQRYATSKELGLAALAFADATGGQFKAQAKGKKPIPHIRAHNVSPAELKAAAKQFGLKQLDPDETQLQLSTQFKHNIYSFDDHGNVFSVVISTKGSKDEGSSGIAKKALAPTGLGLDGQTFTKEELISATNSAIDEKVRDKQLAEILHHLVEIAAKGSGNLDKEEMAYIADSKNVISTDFGEILAPIKIMKKGDKAKFPVGNNPLTDVEVISAKGQVTNYAVKSLTGSGNSFSAITDLMNDYEKDLKAGSPEKVRYDMIKIFKKGEPGSVKDKIIRAAQTVNTKEAESAKRIVGDFKDFDQLMQLVTKKGYGDVDYADFLRWIQPISKAGGWPTDVGMPSDAAYYLSGKKGNAPRDTQAGMNYYKQNAILAIADNIVYMLGVGLHNMATKSEEAKIYNKMMTDIVTRANVYLGKIDIDSAGGLKIHAAPFSGIDFKFQYHAGTNTPGRNAPGFIMAKGGGTPTETPQPKQEKKKPSVGREKR